RRMPSRPELAPPAFQAGLKVPSGSCNLLSGTWDGEFCLPGKWAGVGVLGDNQHKESNQERFAFSHPLRQVVGPTGEAMWVNFCFSTNDLNHWQEKVKMDIENPSKVAKLFEFIVKNQDPDRGDSDFMLAELRKPAKELVIKTARARTVHQLFPIVNPLWDPNDAGSCAMLTRYQELVKFELKNAIPKAINWSVIYNVTQGQHK
uniref:Uncharacterized protein n=1 Tax=Junco hyemalis TaxID=40217 RepID=A0A8C5NSC4_JUNHY